MKIERTKNAARNIVAGTLLKIYQLVGPFILRTIFIYTLGMEYLGLNSLFTSILSVLNLAELGVGSAMIFSMYKPIAEDDDEKICALMKLYRTYYRIIGAVILVIGLILTPFIPSLISGEVPSDINVYVIYLMNLMATVCTYWLFAYKNCLLSAHQRGDISSKVIFVVSTIQYIIQAICLFTFSNYYLYLTITIICNILSNIVIAIVTTKRYPKYKAVGNLEVEEIKSINQRVKDLFTAKFGSVVVSSVDSIVISAFLGVVVLGIYNNYYYIMSSIMGVVGIIFSSCVAGIGNSLVTETVDKNYKDFKIMSFLICWILNVCTACFLCVYQPFMLVWVGKENMLDFTCVILFCIYFFVCELTIVWATYKDAGGIWHEDRFRPLISACANLILNIIFVKVINIGIYGILLSTIISYVCISMPWLVKNLFKLMFKRSAKKYLLQIGCYIFTTVCSCLISYLICYFITYNMFFTIVYNLLIALVVPNVVMFVIFRNTDEFKNVIGIVKRILIKKE